MSGTIASFTRAKSPPTRARLVKLNNGGPQCARPHDSACEVGSIGQAPLELDAQIRRERSQRDLQAAKGVAGSRRCSGVSFRSRGA